MQPPEDESHLTHVPSKVPWVPRPAEPNLLQPNLLDEDVRWVLWKASYLEQICWLLVAGISVIPYFVGSLVPMWWHGFCWVSVGVVRRMESVFLVPPSNWWITPRQCSWSYVWFPAIVILLENIPHHFGIWDAYKPVHDSDSGVVCRCRISCINSAVLLFLLTLPVSIPYSQKMPRVVAVQFSFFWTTNYTNYT